MIPGIMIKRFVHRHVLWVALLAVLAPLGVMLGLQYHWLDDLQDKSAIAEQAYLQNYIEGVSSQVEYYYRNKAERTLNIPAALFEKDSPKKVGYHLRKKAVDGARWLFVVNFSRKDWGGILFFDPAKGEFVEPDEPGLLPAATVALAPWKMLRTKGAAVQSEGLSVEERDPEHRIILNPVTDDGCRVLGVAGMVLDPDHFVREVLPTAVHKSVPSCPESGTTQELLVGGRDDLELGVRDGSGRLVLGTENHEAQAETTGRPAFVFTDWQLTLRSSERTPEEWARSNFLLNISMSSLLAVLVLGGVVFAFRTASREIRLSRMKSDFVSNVSHELRTPLASIRVFGEFLRLGRVQDAAKTREYGEFIETESRRLTQLINNILDFSKIESGAKTYELEPVRPDLLMRDTLRTLEVSLRHKGFKLSYEPPEEALPPITVDRDAITQAIANLVDNAVKYSGDSTEIAVALRRTRDEVLISVRDHGIGISPEEQKKIFERFHRVSTGLVHNVKGSGLGLSIVSHIARAHGGDVTVESQLARGSTFTIRLPLDREQPETTPEEIRDAGRSMGYVEET
jgi:signal transduction histidine kinase